MKNIDMKLIQEYNEGKVSGNEIYNFLQGTIIHLDEDIKRFSRRKNMNTYAKRYIDIQKKCCALQEKTLTHVPFTDAEIQDFEELNKYNNAKNKELIRLAVMVLIFVVISIVVDIVFGK